MALPTCDNYPCENKIRVGSNHQRWVVVSGGRVNARIGLCFCSEKCEVDYFGRETPVPILPVRDIDEVRTLMDARQAAVEIRQAELLKKHSGGRALEPMEEAVLKNQADVEVPRVDTAAGLFSGEEGDKDLTVQWTDGAGNVIEEFTAGTVDELNKWWQSGVSE